MPFSFNPGQITTPGIPGAPPADATGGVPAVLGGLPSNPKSPFYFLQDRSKPISIWGYIQMLLLVIALLSVLICATLFAYGFYLSGRIEAKKEELALAEGSFKEYPFTEMKSFYVRMTALEKLLKSYISVKSPLKYLEYIVENQVYFDDFSLTNTAKGPTITFTAVTKDYKFLIQQLGALNLTQYKKVAPVSQIGTLKDSLDLVKISVTTPVIVQGKLPGEISFEEASDSSASTTPGTKAGNTP